MPRLSVLAGLCLVIETLTTRRIGRLVAAQLYRRRCHPSGLEHVPVSGPFVLAVNHYNGAHSAEAAAAVLWAVSQRRADIAEDIVFIIGQRTDVRLARPTAWLVNMLYRRWSRHALRIALHNGQPALMGLREWRRRAQPAFVFPEGRAALQLGQMRPGVGRWLAALGQPVIPAGVWLAEDGWHIRLGAPVQWAARPDLRDVQLGLHMAALLPPALAPGWAELLARWQASQAQPLPGSL
jgi:1-acyl-sn-glycerol-3-phosphate acyltransferase